jgi:2-keto-4-pentenoate hydratase
LRNLAHAATIASVTYSTRKENTMGQHDTDEAVAAVTKALVEARANRQPAPAAPFADALQHAEQAYAVQAAVAKAIGAEGATFWKSGAPSRAVTLTHAGLPPQGVWSSPAEAGAMHFNLRGVEAEVALRLGRDISPADAAALTHENAAACVDAMTVSIEIVDSRWQDVPSVPPLLKLADFQVHGVLAVGEWKPFAQRDWAQQTCTVRIGAGAAQAFRGTHTLADPTWLLPLWLRHATRNGATVKKGTGVTTGTWCGLLMAKKGDLVRVAFEGIGEAQVQL